MNRKTERLVKRIEKAGIRASVKEGHVLTEAELRNLKVQVLPNPLRVVFFIAALVAGGFSCYYFAAGNDFVGFLLAIVSALLLFFGLVGVRRTLSKTLDAMDAMSAADITVAAFEGIASAVESLFDGL